MSDARYPFILLTGRGSAAKWHTQTRTSKSEDLKKLYPADVYVELNPRDAGELKIRSGDWVTVSSQRGNLQAKAVVVRSVPSRQIFVPMHYGATNLLTDAVFDPHSFQPAHKACAVRLERRSMGDA
jgi:anaerobic selenocysteine-containing dehydrogenase